VSDEKRVDEDWKKRAEEEKEKLLEESRKAQAGAPAATDGASAGEPGGSIEEGDPAAPGETVADPRFRNLIYNLAAQAMMGMGQAEDPHTGQRGLDLNLARESIEVLGMIETKTKGNLAGDEETLLGELLRQLRLSYAQVVHAQKEQASQPPPEASGG